MFGRSIFVFLGLLPCLQLAGQAGIQFRLITAPEHRWFGALAVEGLEKALLVQLDGQLPKLESAALIRAFPIQANGDVLTGLPPMLGHLEIGENLLLFIPRFPFEQGRAYACFFSVEHAYARVGVDLPPGVPKVCEKRVKIPRLQEYAAPSVMALYPSGIRWPANQLKFYLYFSAPMRYGEALRRIRLFDEAGCEIIAPFLELGQELWDNDGLRLTIWFDPGRIKRGLIPNQQYGQPLQAGKKYRLMVSRQWKDTRGQELGSDFEKWIEVVAEDRRQPDVKDWILAAPQPGSRQPLQAHFPEPLDYALLLNSLWVVNEQGRPLPGSVEVLNEERLWRFIPERSWNAGPYRFRVSTRLEDLAGNNLQRLFDTDLTVEQPIGREQDFAELVFVVEDL